MEGAQTRPRGVVRLQVLSIVHRKHVGLPRCARCHPCRAPREGPGRDVSDSSPTRPCSRCDLPPLVCPDSVSGRGAGCGVWKSRQYDPWTVPE